MKKWTVILLTVILLFSFAACSKADEPNPYRVKTRTSETYENGRITYYRYSQYFYDENGYLSHQKDYSDNTPQFTHIYERDAYGNLLTTITLDNNNQETRESHILTLDEDHRVIRDESSYGAITEYAYDENGNQTMLNINRVGALDGQDLVSYLNMTYDKNGNLIRQDQHWEPTGEGGYVLYDYKNQKLVKEISYNLDDTLDGYAEYSYDDSGLVQTEILYDAESAPVRKTIRTFDSYGNIEEKSIYELREYLPGGGDSVVDSRITYVYESINVTE
mgnify:CR=1 FL=1